MKDVDAATQQDMILSQADDSPELPEVQLDEKGTAALRSAFDGQSLGYSATARVLRIAQVIAQQSGEGPVGEEHIAQAVQLHSQNRELAGHHSQDGAEHGSGRRTAPVPLEHIPGQEHVKRALEVALAGDHSIGLIAAQGAKGDARLLAQWARSQGATVHVATACPCGYLGRRQREDLGLYACSKEKVAAWREENPAYQQVMNTDISVEVDQPMWWAMERRLEGQEAGEPGEVVAGRAAEAGGRAKVERFSDSHGQEILEGTSIRLGMNEQRQERVMAVTETIARLSESDGIAASHVAEAVHCCPRRS